MVYIFKIIKFVQTLYNFLIKMSLLRLLTFLISGYSIKLMPGSKAPKSEFVWHLLTPIRFYSKIKEENRKEKYNKGR